MFIYIKNSRFHTSSSSLVFNLHRCLEFIYVFKCYVCIVPFCLSNTVVFHQLKYSCLKRKVMCQTKLSYKETTCISQTNIILPNGKIPTCTVLWPTSKILHNGVISIKQVAMNQPHSMTVNSGELAAATG